MTGIQIIHLHSIVGQLKKISTATLFIDLRSAFHHMIREFIFATHNTLLRSTLSQCLDEKDFDIEKLDADLTDPLPS